MVAYSKAIQQLQLGAGAAVTLVMLPIIAVLVVILVRMMRRSDQPGAADLGRRRLTPAQRKALPWVIVVGSVLVLVWASPHIIWKAALVLGVFVVLAAAVGRVVSVLATRGNRLAARLVGGVGSGVALVALLGFVLAPIYWMTITAFKSDDQIVARTDDLWPTPWSTEQFTTLFTGRAFGTWYVNTILVSVASTVIALVCAALAGYALARLKFRGSESFTVTILLTYVMPGALLFIPLYQLMSGIGLNDSLWSLVLAYPTFTLPFATWLLVGYFKSIPADLEEAALVDGCTRFGAFRRIVLPLAKPGLLAVALFTLTNAWNEFLFAFVFITKDDYKTLPVGMQSMIFGDVVPQGQLAAASLLISIPVVLMYGFGQRFLTEGLTAGAVKG
jgi:multiple sugar transport system permease protein